jgi:glycolate oxidase FAD binding subunit
MMDMVMTPKSEAELAQMIADAQGPLHIQGGGTRAIGRAVQGQVLSTAGLSGITLYEPGALTLVAQAGTPLADIEAALDAEGQRLAFEPMDHRGLLGTTGTPTIGGVIATNTSGPRRMQSGAARDFMLGVRFVDGSGTVVQNGGRVMKNVTGYDLVKLLSGSWGTLGVLSEVSLKTLPKPEAAACLTISGLNLQSSVRVMAQAMTSPYEITGAAYVQGDTRLRIEGFAGSVPYRVEQLQALLSAYNVQATLDHDQVALIWRDIRDVVPLQRQAGDVWRISCKPSDAPDLVDRLQADQVMLDWGGGLIWALMSEGTDARARLGAYDGHATLIRGSDQTRVNIASFQPQSVGLATLTKGIRAKFDPRGLLNPGLME